MPKKRILIIEDDYCIAESLKSLIELEMDVEIEVAENGLIGLSKLRSRPYDMYLLDVLMPVMDGNAFMEIVQRDARLRAIPFIVTSASSVQKKFPPGTTFVKKPMTIENLFFWIEQKLGGVSLRREQ